ncbi:SDR family NAD(P)-dependent oxidoreductase [Actinokineospora bangkokensis]|uniref:Short-chain dehydrogenase n=1 Tax=Actinokineospora bangkokensis TaxID=1193682 RepID=A0A1Q9LLF6_9PSEU|nr:SDR family NAD(P)-dependent oxidoreductase [Actinokineospora bangkokensis]OLR92829.1 short-chain dehydrogenase [Actinokineospora bangkokensis]
MEHENLLTGKTILVTGAGRGIGAAAARLFAAEGAQVVLAARSEDQLKAVAEDITAAGGQAHTAVCDLADQDSVAAAVLATTDRFGKLDGAFNNGATGQPPGPMDGLDPAEFDRVYAVNLRGQWLAMVAEVKAIRATSGSGAIVNTSSIGSLVGNPVLPAYGAMKRGVNSLTESAALTYAAEGIRVNGVAPGPILTEMLLEWEASTPGVLDDVRARTPLGRAGTPEEVAHAAAWLLSDRSSYVTGVTLSVDGGLHAL